MQNFWLGVLSSFVANCFWLLVIVSIGWVAFNISYRSKIKKFFGVNNTRKLVIYISNLFIKFGRDGGAIGIDGKLRSFQGATIVHGEYFVSELLRDNFRYRLPFMSGQPGLISKLLLADIQVEILPSPREEAEIESESSIISVGSPGYNLVSRYIEDELQSKARFTDDNSGIVVGRATSDSDTSHALVSRMYDREKKRSVFYAAGISELGTKGALFFLANEWQRLYREFGSKQDFNILIELSNGDYSKSSVIYKAS